MTWFANGTLPTLPPGPVDAPIPSGDLAPYVDISASQAINSAGQLFGGNNSDPWNSASVALPSGTATPNSRFRTKFVAGANGDLHFLFSRRKVVTGTVNCYALGIAPPGTVDPFLVTDGGAAFMPGTFTVASGSFATTPGTAYQPVLETVQTNPTTTTLTLKLYDNTATFDANDVTTATPLGVGSITDTTARFQTGGTCATGVNGWFNFTGHPTTGPFVTGAYAFTDTSASATGYTVTLPPSGPAGSPVSVVLATVGGNGLAATLNVTLTDDLGTVVSPTLASGAGSSTTPYTPTLAGRRTFLVSHTGGNGGFTDPAVSPFQALQPGAPVVIAANASCVVESPWNWSPGALSGGRQTFRVGAYRRLYVQNTSQATVYFDAASDPTAQFSVSVNEGPYSAPAAVPGSGNLLVNTGLASAGSAVVEVVLCSISTASTGQYTRANFLGIDHFSVDNGGSADPTTAAANTGIYNLMVAGDSIEAGFYAGFAAESNVLFSNAWTVGRAFRRKGFEFGIIACGGQNICLAGLGGVPQYLDAYNRIDSTHAIPTDGSGAFVPQVDLFYDEFGVNGGATDATFEADYVTLWGQLKTAIPRGLIVKGVPWAGSPGAVLAAYATYGPSTNPNLRVIDWGPAVYRKQGSTSDATTWGGLHPNAWGQENLTAYLGVELGMLWQGFKFPGGGAAPFRRRSVRTSRGR